MNGLNYSKKSGKGFETGGNCKKKTRRSEQFNFSKENGGLRGSDLKKKTEHHRLLRSKRSAWEAATANKPGVKKKGLNRAHITERKTLEPKRMD